MFTQASLRPRVNKSITLKLIDLERLFLRDINKKDEIVINFVAAERGESELVDQRRDPRMNISYSYVFTSGQITKWTEEECQREKLQKQTEIEHPVPHRASKKVNIFNLLLESFSCNIVQLMREYQVLL